MEFFKRLSRDVTPKAEQRLKLTSTAEFGAMQGCGQCGISEGRGMCPNFQYLEERPNKFPDEFSKR
jgi:hypothetical protein